MKRTDGASQGKQEAIANYKHPVKPGIVTIAGQPNDDLPKGTVSSILRQAGIKLDKEGNR